VTACLRASHDRGRRADSMFSPKDSPRGDRFELTGMPTFASMSASNRLAAKRIRHRSPRRAVIVCADDDRHTDGKPNIGIQRPAEAARAVCGRSLSLTADRRLGRVQTSTICLPVVAPRSSGPSSTLR
jgi:hypothetical protein